MTTANTSITRTIKERRTLTRYFEPRTFKGAERSSNFYATGITVERNINPGHPSERLQDYLTYQIEGYHVKRDGTRSTGRGASDHLSFSPSWEHLGLRYAIDEQHVDEIHQLYTEARAAFDAVDWEKVPA